MCRTRIRARIVEEWDVCYCFGLESFDQWDRRRCCVVNWDNTTKDEEKKLGYIVGKRGDKENLRENWENVCGELRGWKRERCEDGILDLTIICELKNMEMVKGIQGEEQLRSALKSDRDQFYSIGLMKYWGFDGGN